MILENICVDVRLKRIEFKNFRNIESGAIDFPNTDAKDCLVGNSSILGLYGQNGSGKSSVIMAIGILKDILSGLKISKEYESCIRSGCDSCTLKFVFVQKDNKQIFREYYYDFDIRKRVKKHTVESVATEERSSFIIENEILKARIFDLSGKLIKPKTTIFDTITSEGNTSRVFGCNKEVYALLTNNCDFKVESNYVIAKMISREYGTSFLFSQDFIDIPLEKYRDTNNFDMFENLDNKRGTTEFEHELNKLKHDEQIAYLLNAFLSPITILKYYGLRYLWVIDTKTTGLINTNVNLPLLLWKRRKNNNEDIFVYKYSLLMDKPTEVQEEYYFDSVKAIKAISEVLSKIVPGMELDITDLGKRLSKDNKTEHCFEILSKRNDHTIPLKYESDGIRRMVSILSLLIAVYNEESFTIAIDEIDSGIFEYMLGEILSVMSDSIKGQFVFTSHNLRPLEVLPAKYLCFTTTNPKSRFTTLSRRGNSNMRDTYFRNIVLGSNNGKDPIYNSTDKFEIERAFYKAGHPEDDEL